MLLNANVAQGLVNLSATVADRQVLMFLFFAGIITSTTCLVMLSLSPAHALAVGD